MYFNKLLLKDFGKFHNKEIVLKPGVNVITGSRNSGKSTVGDFAYSMLYGINYSPETEADDLQHQKPMDGRGFSGKAYLQDDSNYLIERSFLKNNATTQVMEVQSGRMKKLANRNTLYETMTDMDRKRYSDVMYVRQFKPGEYQAEEFNAYVTNLATTGASNLDKRRALAGLKSKKNELNVEPIERQIADLEEDLTQYEGDEETLKQVRREISETKEELAIETAKRKREARRLIDTSKQAVKDDDDDAEGEFPKGVSASAEAETGRITETENGRTVETETEKSAEAGHGVDSEAGKTAEAEIEHTVEQEKVESGGVMKNAEKEAGTEEKAAAEATTGDSGEETEKPKKRWKLFGKKKKKEAVSETEAADSSDKTENSEQKDNHDKTENADTVKDSITQKDSVAEKTEVEPQKSDRETERIFLDADLLAEYKPKRPLSEQFWFICLTGLFVVLVITALVFSLPFDNGVRQLFIVCTILFVILTIVDGMNVKGMLNGENQAPSEEEFKRIVYELERKNEAYEEVEIDMSFAKRYVEIVEDLQAAEFEILRRLKAKEEIEDELRVCRQRRKSIEREIQAITLAINTVNELSRDFIQEHDYIINGKSQEIMRSVTGGKYEDAKIDNKLRLAVKTKGAYMDIANVPQEDFEMVRLAVHLSVIRELGANMPVIIDGIPAMPDEQLLATVACMKELPSDQVILLSDNQRLAKVLETAEFEFTQSNLA